MAHPFKSNLYESSRTSAAAAIAEMRHTEEGLAVEPSGSRAGKPNASVGETASGGQTTISPPVNVNNTPASTTPVLTSGIDTLYLAIDIIWTNPALFTQFTEYKKAAQFHDEPQTISFNKESVTTEWVFHVMPNGIKGYEWLLQNKEYTLKIGNWVKPKSRPSVMIEIRSETLWSHGPVESVNRMIDFLEYQGAFIVQIKPSRVDLCLDYLMDSSQWLMDLIINRVTRSKYAAPHFHNNELTGISIGRGHLSARLYDKPLEIKTKNSKTWMFDVWGIDGIADGKKIIRVEFQLRRQALNELNIHTIEDLLKYSKNIWGYCTQKWLRFQDNPGKHHTQRKDLPWWVTIQNGFQGCQRPIPLIRSKAIELDRSKLASQAYGLLTSISAVSGRINSGPVQIGDILTPFMEELKIKNIDGDVIKEDIEKKIAKHRRDEAKADIVRCNRMENSFPYLKTAKPAQVLEPELISRQSSRRRLPSDQHRQPACSRLADDGHGGGGPSDRSGDGLNTQ